jgi:transcriptional regulator with XRE-family HTH domain
MNFYERLKQICQQNNTSPTALCKTLGISTSKVTAWNNGSMPAAKVSIKIADYFGVTVDYLLGKEDAPTTDASLSEHEAKLLTMFRAVPADKQEYLLRIIEDALQILQ